MAWQNRPCNKYFKDPTMKYFFLFMTLKLKKKDRFTCETRGWACFQNFKYMLTSLNLLNSKRCVYSKQASLIHPANELANEGKNETMKSYIQNSSVKL